MTENPPSTVTSTNAVPYRSEAEAEKKARALWNTALMRFTPIDDGAIPNISIARASRAAMADMAGGAA